MHKHNTKPGRVGGSASLYRKNIGPVVYGSEKSPILPELKKKRGKSARKVIVSVERALVLVVVAILFALGTNSMIERQDNLFVIERASVSLATALESVSETIPYEEIVEQTENISVFDFSFGAYDVIKRGFEGLKGQVEESKI
jgi:hypothetical protein